MAQNNEPAAGVWRDARTQEIRPSENPQGTRWLVEISEGYFRTAAFNQSRGLFFVRGVGNGGHNMKYRHIIRYARINT